MSSQHQSECGCLYSCRRDDIDTSQHGVVFSSGGSYCKKAQGIPFKHRPMSEMELEQLEAAQRADDQAAKELCIAEVNLRQAQKHKTRTAEVLSHWMAATSKELLGGRK